MRINVRVNIQPTHRTISRAVERAVEPVSIQVANDSNKFVAKDTGSLEASVFTSSDFGNGKVIWGTKYAAMVYHNTSFRLNRTKNTKAQALWFEVAKAQDIGTWTRVADNAIKSNL